MKTNRWTIAFASAMVLGLLAYTVTAQIPGSGEQPPLDGQGHPGGAERGERDRDFRPPPHPVMTALDTDNDSELSAKEIADAVAALKKLDKDGDGKLSREEMRPQFGGHGGRPGPEGPDRPGLGALITWTVASEGISMRGTSGAKLGERSVFYLAFDSAADADRASEALTNALNR